MLGPFSRHLALKRVDEDYNNNYIFSREFSVMDYLSFVKLSNAELGECKTLRASKFQ